APSGEKARLVTSPGWPVSVARTCQDSTSHKTIVLSCPPEASTFPLGEKATASAPAACRFSVRTGFRTTGAGGAPEWPALAVFEPSDRSFKRYQAAPTVPVSRNARATQGNKPRLPRGTTRGGGLADGTSAGAGNVSALSGIGLIPCRRPAPGSSK